MGGTSVVLFFIAFLEEREGVDLLVLLQNELVYTFPFLLASNEE